MSERFPSSFSGPEQSPGYQLWLVSNLWQRHIRKALQPFSLTHVQFTLLAVAAWLSDRQEEVTQVQVANNAGTDPMMTSQVLRTLAERRLLTREPHPRDARAVCVRLTEGGGELLGEALKAVEGADMAFVSVLGPEVGTLTRLLHTLADRGTADRSQPRDAS